MSEQKTKSFMQELDQWMKTAVIDPLVFGDDPDEDPNARNWEDLIAEVRNAIRQKVLESYRNGQKAGPQQIKQIKTHR